MLTESRSQLGRQPISGDDAKLALQSSSVVATLSVSLRGEFISANPRFIQLMGWNDLSGLLNLSFRHGILASEADWQHWERAAVTHRVTGQEMALIAVGDRRIALKGDIWAISNPNGGVDHLFGAFVDVTQARSVEAVLGRTARNEAISSITGGMIHDFKNLLTVLIGNLYLVAEGVRDNPKLFEQAKRARDVARRGADLTQQLLSLSREVDLQPKTLDIGKLVVNLEPVLERALGPRIRLALEIAPDVAPIDANAAQLESAIINLVVNARDAIAESGTITISLSQPSSGRAENPGYETHVAQYVQLAVEDDGAGIPERLQQQVFEPFCSTKGERGGTGLGLSMVRLFANSHGGTVTLYSRPDEGTKITLHLPVSTGKLEDSAVLTMPLKSLPSGHEDILLFAGDSTLAKTVLDSLVILGYRVHASNASTEVCAELATDRFQLLIIDSSAGRSFHSDQLSRVIRSGKRPVPLIFVGDSEQMQTKDFEGAESLTKPFSLFELATKVRAVLDGYASA